MDIDLTPVLQPLLEIIVAVLGAAISYAALRLAQRLHINVSAERQQLFDQALHKALTYGIGQAHDAIAAKGWDHPEVKNAVLRDALAAVVVKFPDAIRGVGLTPDAASLAVREALERAWPSAAAAAAASPVTPPTGAPVAAVSNPGP